MVRYYTVKFRDDQEQALLNMPQRHRQGELSNLQTDRDWVPAWWTLPSTLPTDTRQQPPKYNILFWLGLSGTKNSGSDVFNIFVKFCGKSVIRPFWLIYTMWVLKQFLSEDMVVLNCGIKCKVSPTVVILSCIHLVNFVTKTIKSGFKVFSLKAAEF